MCFEGKKGENAVWFYWLFPAINFHWKSIHAQKLNTMKKTFCKVLSFNRQIRLCWKFKFKFLLNYSSSFYSNSELNDHEKFRSDHQNIFHYIEIQVRNITTKHSKRSSIWKRFKSEGWSFDFYSFIFVLCEAGWGFQKNPFYAHNNNDIVEKGQVVKEGRKTLK